MPHASFPHMMSTSQANPELNLALVGAGIISLTLSVALTSLGIKHTIYEQSSSLNELGAGLGFGPNAARALKVIDPDLHKIFERVGTFAGKASQPQAETAKPVWIEFLSGTASLSDQTSADPSFTVYATHGKGHAAVHRAKWLDILASRVTAPIIFSKRFQSLTQPNAANSEVEIHFADGTTVHHSGVIGCDGVKSKVRTALFPEAKCTYSGKYAYRCLAPLSEAAALLGEGRAGVSSLWMGPSAHILTFPVLNFLNMVCFVTDSNPTWPRNSTSLTVPTTKADAIRDYTNAGFSSTVLALLNMIPDDDSTLIKWGLFDLADNPPPRYWQNRAMIIGDAAHASTPHHGAGAGFGMEDVAVLKGLFQELLELGGGVQDLEHVFSQFDASRRERDQWLVQSSRRAADLYELRLGDISIDEMRRDIETRQEICWGFDVEGCVTEAKKGLRARFGGRP